MDCFPLLLCSWNGKPVYSSTMGRSGISHTRPWRRWGHSMVGVSEPVRRHEGTRLGLGVEEGTRLPPLLLSSANAVLRVAQSHSCPAAAVCCREQLCGESGLAEDSGGGRQVPPFKYRFFLPVPILCLASVTILVFSGAPLAPRSAREAEGGVRLHYCPSSSPPLQSVPES